MAKEKSATEIQQSLIAALMRPECYPHPAEGIRRIETHISTVLLTGPYAYKIKKPIDLGFLDFTTLALRRHFCETELRLNRRLAPALYLDVVAICGTPESPRLCLADAADTAASVIEYAVKMKQFPQDGLLDRLLANNQLQPLHIDLLAQIVAGFHRAAPQARSGEAFGRPEKQKAFMQQNFDQIRERHPDREVDNQLNAIERWSLATHEALLPLMEQRRRRGFVRECHGDLHLGNIALVDGGIQIFDCIEFNADLRWTDVAAEIAFLVMDLAARGHPQLGARFLNAYLEITGDYEATDLLPCYLAYRAMVRAKIACIRSQQPNVPEPERTVATDEFRRYLQLAAGFMQGRKHCLIVTHGLSGSGKTTLTQPLLEHIGALRLRSDVVRKRLHGLAAQTRSHSAVDAGLYNETSTQATYDELFRLARRLIDAGWPVIVDATFLQQRQRTRFRALATETGVPFLLLHFHAAPETLRRRIAQRSITGADASEATLTVLEKQLGSAEPLSTEERGTAMTIDSEQDDGIGIAEKAAACLFPHAQG